VDLIADVMRRGEWVRGESAGLLAAEWGVAKNTVEQLSAEAWRRVCEEADDAEQARPTIAGTLAVSLAQAAESREYKAVASLGDVWSKVVGARAPERTQHDVNLTVQAFAKMTMPEKIAEIDRQIAALQEARAKLVRNMPALPVGEGDVG
jgi:hypothetical protein